MTQTEVASRIGCTQSQVSQVEAGSRVLRPWLAEALDTVYGTAGLISLLAGSAEADTGDGEVVVVALPGCDPFALSRRQFLTAVGIGTVGALPGLSSAVADVRPTADLVDELRGTFAGLRSASRELNPQRIVPALMGQVALIDAVRHDAGGQVREDLGRLQTRVAETLSWMAEEAGDARGALFWIDRTGEWARRSGWDAMQHYTAIRRSMLALSTASHGAAAVEHALPVMDDPTASARLRGLAAKQVAFGHAVAGRASASRYALDLAERHLSASDPRDELSSVGQTSLDSGDLLALIHATCDVYLGGGATAIGTLAPHLPAIGAGSARSGAINTAKLAQAYANAGAPDEAVKLAGQVLTAVNVVDSASTRMELRRLAALLSRWPNRDDVAHLRRQLEQATSPQPHRF